jgi:hypothetical protein
VPDVLPIFAAEPSKVPVYVVGAVFATWAVALAGVGLTRPNFPFGVAGQRLVMLVSLLLAAATIAAAIGTS